MTARHYYRNAAGTLVEAAVRIGFETHQNAEEGSVGSGRLTVDDPDGTLNIGGHRRWMIVEDAVPEPTNQVVWFGYTAERGIGRGPSLLTEAARQWSVDVVDANSVLARRIMVDADRPFESDVARIAWLIASSESGIIDDTRFVSAGNHVTMDPVDYEGQRVLDVIDDCAQASGKNYWLDWFADVGAIGLWYGRAGLPDYEATIALSNVLSDVDDDAIFELSADAKLNRDPGRVYSGVYLPFDGGEVYREKPSTADEFARRDTAMPSANVKTAGTAARRATRYLNDLDTESDRLTTSLWVPATHVNRVRPGQRINVRASHLPGYETFTPMRVLSRGVTQLEDEHYRLDLELSAGDTLPGVGNGGARLYCPFNQDGLDLYPQVGFHATGDDPCGGRSYFPLSGPLSYVPIEGSDLGWIGIRVDSPGVISVKFNTSMASVVEGAAVATISVLVDGEVVASDAESTTGGLRFFGSGLGCAGDGIAVGEGAIISADFSLTTGTGSGGKVPAGVGNPAEYLEITGVFEEIA